MLMADVTDCDTIINSERMKISNAALLNGLHSSHITMTTLMFGYKWLNEAYKKQKQLFVEKGGDSVEFIKTVVCILRFPLGPNVLTQSHPARG